MSESHKNEGKEQPQQGFPDLSNLGNLNMGGLFDGVANLIGKIGELAEKGEQFRKSQGESGTAQTGSFTAANNAVAGSYGFNVRFGPGQDGTSKVQPFARTRSGNDSKSNTMPDSESNDARKQSSPVDRMREPHVDLFEEEGFLLIVAEMPGVAAENVQLQFNGRHLLISGSGNKVDFRREIELPLECKESDVTVNANNGVIEIKIAVSSPT